MESRIISIRARNGSGVIVSVTTETENGPVTVALPLGDEQYLQLHPVKGPISPETLEQFTAASSLCHALERGARMLSASTHSGKELTRKLRLAGETQQDAEQAVAALRERGMINEEQDALRLAERCVKKGWGPRRVLSELYAKGYGESAQTGARAYLETVDFEDVCDKVLAKVRLPAAGDRTALQKLQASLLRRGFLPSTIRECIKRALSNR